MRVRIPVLTVAAVVLATGLAHAVPPAAGDRPYENPVDPTIVDGSAQRALDGARERWRAKGFRSYRQQLSRSCFCPTAGDVHEVTVAGGRLRRPVPPEVAEVATVPRQFRLVQRAIDGRVSGLEVRYGKRGNPVSIGIDPSRLTVDEETSYRMHRLIRAGRR